jgi:hypothetical protein
MQAQILRGESPQPPFIKGGFTSPLVKGGGEHGEPGDFRQRITVEQ